MHPCIAKSLTVVWYLGIVPVAHRETDAFLLRLVFVHGVLKRLHHLLLKYVKLWHAAKSSHDFLQASMLDTFPGELLMYTSPAFKSHWMPLMGALNVQVVGAGVVPGVVPVVLDVILC